MQEFLYLETLFLALSLLILVRKGLDKKHNKLAMPLVGINTDCNSWMTLAGIADGAKQYFLCPIWNHPICFPCRPQSKSWGYCWLCFRPEEHTLSANAPMILILSYHDIISRKKKCSASPARSEYFVYQFCVQAFVLSSLFLQATFAVWWAAVASARVSDEVI